MNKVIATQKKKDKILIEPWTNGAVRIRQTRLKEFKGFNWALSEKLDIECVVKSENSTHEMILPDLKVSMDMEGYLSFSHADNKEAFLVEKHSPRAYREGGRMLRSNGADFFKASVYFEAQEDEAFWGLGQHQYNALNQKGLVIPLSQMNSQVSVPLLISSKGYGIFWNNPAVGQVELARNWTCFLAEKTEQLDYFVIAGPDPASILAQYYEITGYPSALPEWATGFWQCKLRYETQDELMAVAREHKKRKLPLSVIVVDYFHWEKQGEWDFDSKAWPDPEKMVRELKDMGVETMVSVWPSVNPDSQYYEEMDSKGFLLETDKGTNAAILFTDTYEKGKKYIHFYDATMKEAGDYVWSKVRDNYLRRGVKTYWLDACEPETIPYDYDNLRYAEGNGAAVGSIYPLLHEKNFFENMKADGVEEPLNLCRSAWAGSQKYGAAVWSGDIDSTFETLEIQMKAGLNMVSSGIPWWTTDIGGFFGGEISDPFFRELIIRWFQFALFCPIFRLHGFRNSWDPKKGGDNEVWSFGEEAYSYIVKYLKFRESLRPYIRKSADEACNSGYPLMRPLVFDFFKDPKVREIEDQFLFGSDILVAPVYKSGITEREVYLPDGRDWINPYTKEIYEGGQLINTKAPLNRIPIYLRKGSGLEPLFSILL